MYRRGIPSIQIRLETVRHLRLGALASHLEATIQPFLKDLQWINLGGGYLFNEGQDHDRLSRLILHLQDRYGLQLLFEPGASISRKAGYIVSSVVDIFSSDGKQVAVLDTTVNHMPEVFEYQFEPDLVGEVPDGKYEYILAGSTCLAGDLFGVYKLNKQLQVGSRLVFENSGAYTLVKASMFNGVNLPAIYILNRDKSLSLIKHFGFQDYLSLCGAE